MKNSSIWVKDPPKCIHLELTSKCNMACRFCPSPILKRKRQDMPEHLVHKILNEIRDKNVLVQFHVLGEPLLNSNFFEYAQMCDDFGIKYDIVTNGILCDEVTTNKIFSLKKINRLYVSFHCMDEETFTNLRGCKIDYKNYINNINNIIYSTERYKNEIPISILIMYDFNHPNLWGNFTFERWEKFKNQIKEWEDNLHSKYESAKKRYPGFFSKSQEFIQGKNNIWRGASSLPNRLFEDCASDAEWISCQIFPFVLITVKKFFLFGGDESYIRHATNANGRVIIHPASNFSCSLPRELAILSNGDITFCCLDYEGKLACGNIENMSLTEALESEKRKLLIAKPDTFPFCRDCKGSYEIMPNTAAS